MCDMPGTISHVDALRRGQADIRPGPVRRSAAVEHDLADMALGEEQLLCRDDVLEGEGGGDQWTHLALFDRRHEPCENSRLQRGAAEQLEVFEVQHPEIE